MDEESKKIKTIIYNIPPHFNIDLLILDIGAGSGLSGTVLSENEHV